jgi:glycosyltransferase involved in cell wall biosynthesis
MQASLACIKSRSAVFVVIAGLAEQIFQNRFWKFQGLPERVRPPPTCAADRVRMVDRWNGCADMKIQKSSRKFVVYWNNIPTPYMVERFNALADRGAFEFEAWFSDRIYSSRSWAVDESSWRFKYRYLPTTRVGTRTLHWLLPMLGRRPDMIVSLYAEPVFILGWLVAKIRGIASGFWVEVTFDRWVKRSRLKEAIKRWLFPRMDVIVTVGDDGRDFSIKYGAKPENIYFAPHVIDVAHFQTNSTIAVEERLRLRHELGVHGVTFIYVGRLWWGKGINDLIDAFERVQRELKGEASLLVVGDGPEESNLKRLCAERNISNVVFAGFRQKSELPHLYAASDVFVFPTLGDPYGLVVDEAMACSLPVISTSSAGEIRDRVEEGVNGFIVPPENSAALAQRMVILAGDADLRQRMGEQSVAKIQGHTPDRWAGDFERIVGARLSK